MDRSTSPSSPKNFCVTPKSASPNTKRRTARGESCQPGGCGALSCAASAASSVANFASAGGLIEVLVTIVAFAVLCFITYAFFVYGERLVRYLGPAGLSVVTRIMGLILAVIGIQMLIDGIGGAVDAYRGLTPG